MVTRPPTVQVSMPVCFAPCAGWSCPHVASALTGMYFCTSIIHNFLTGAGPCGSVRGSMRLHNEGWRGIFWLACVEREPQTACSCSSSVVTAIFAGDEPLNRMTLIPACITSVKVP